MNRTRRVPTMPIRESHIPNQRDVVEAEIPNTRINHAIRRESHRRSNDRSCEDIPPVVKLIDSQRTSYERRAQHRHVYHDELPVRWMVIRPDLQLRV